MGKVVIVNENDEVLGVKERSERVEGDICRGSILWLTDREGNILMAQRSFTKSTAPGVWGAAAGGIVDEGEDYDSNIINETREEIGLALDINDLQKGPKVSTSKIFCQWYMGVIDHKPAEAFVLQEEEVHAVKWFTPEELKREIKTAPERFAQEPFLLEQFLK